jgi:hypothetical protein
MDIRPKRKKTGGRQKGTPNKQTALLKDAILQAAIKTGGGKDGLVKYLRERAEENPAAFMTLLGKVLPMQVANDDSGEPFKIINKIELTAPKSDSD